VRESEPARRSDLRAGELNRERGETRATRSSTGEHAADGVGRGQKLANQDEAEKATAELKRRSQEQHWPEEHRPLERTCVNDFTEGLLQNEDEGG
jgi:hypothetical protein